MSILQGKTLIAIGDSLIYGNQLGNAVTWPNLLGEKHGMTVHNFGKNGNTLACQTRYPEQIGMCVRYKDMPDGADYVVVLGGANDKRLSIPIGEDDSTDPYTFKGAVNQLIDGLINKYPKAKILFMTNYHRYDSQNAIGLTDLEYVKAMEEVCHRHSIPCFNTYYNIGISFQHPAHLAWMDEGMVKNGTPNRHFSDEAYTWMMNRYEAVLKML